jgi:SAC3/GANP family
LTDYYYIFFYVVFALHQTHTAELSTEQRRMKATAFALELRAALALHNYRRFFRLYRDCPHLGSNIASKLVPDVRFRALQIICTSYRPTNLAVSVVTRLLDFQTDDECTAYISSCGGVWNSDRTMLLTRQVKSLSKPSNAEERLDDDAAKGITHSIL